MCSTIIHRDRFQLCHGPGYGPDNASTTTNYSIGESAAIKGSSMYLAIVQTIVVDCHQSLDIDDSELMAFSVQETTVTPTIWHGGAFWWARTSFAHNNVVSQMKAHYG